MMMKTMNKNTKDTFYRIKMRAALEYEKTARKMRTAAQISDAMQSRGINGRQFAELLHRNPSEISKWLSGTHNFTQDLLAEISMVLGVEITGAKQVKTIYRYTIASYYDRVTLGSTSTSGRYKVTKKSKARGIYQYL